MSNKEKQYSECLLNLPPHQRSCASCEKLRECAHGLKVIRGEVFNGEDSITQGLMRLEVARDETDGLAELRTGPCLLNLHPVFRECATCTYLYKCLHGQKIEYGDMSITDKVLKLDMIITDVSKLKTMTLEELREYNRAMDTYEKRGIAEKRGQTLTAGFYDHETKKWVTNIHTGADGSNAQDSVGKGLTGGYWDPEKKRWVAKK